jgi:hypothetical protein
VPVPVPRRHSSVQKISRIKKNNCREFDLQNMAKLLLAKFRGRLETNLSQFPTMESISVFTDEGKDMITAVSTPTKSSRRLATASMIFEKLHSPRKLLCGGKMEQSDYDESVAKFYLSKDRVKDKSPKKSLENPRTHMISVSKQFSKTGACGIGLLLCTHAMGYQVIGMTGNSAAKDIMVNHSIPPIISINLVGFPSDREYFKNAMYSFREIPRSINAVDDYPEQ